MGRTADYTILGFIYQFNKSLESLLDSNECDFVSIEGIIEDIEVHEGSKINAIQCKYHEAQDKFQLSLVYKPILQMMEHFYDNGNIIKGINYKLYAYFPNESEGNSLKLSYEDVEEILKTTNEKFQRYITKLKNNIDIRSFIDCFCIEFGLSLDNLVQRINEKFKTLSFVSEEIDTLIYPNAIHMISQISIKHDISQRQVNKNDFIATLRTTRKTAITKWTMSLKNHKQILAMVKKQLQQNLSLNSRIRYFIISGEYVENFNEYIVNFIKEYLDKYHCKILHDKTPLFCLDCPIESFIDIEERLYKKGILFNDGFISSKYFDEVKLFKEPMVTYVNKHRIKEREFSLRLLHIAKVQLINNCKCDDLFIISNNIYTNVDASDIEVEHIELSDINEIKYILGMRDTYE